MTSDLFADGQGFKPLAARQRPSTLQDYVGQTQLLAPDKPLRLALDTGQLHSLILWGPPGVGKTTLARMLAANAKARFLQLSAVMCGVRDIRDAVQQAQQARAEGQDTVLFVDEAHRFNKSQQDAFLPYVEDGTLIFMGATTQNPAFELNNALLSRCRVYRLRALSAPEIAQVLHSALQATEPGLTADDEAIGALAEVADGDARRGLNLLELAIEVTAANAAGDRQRLTLAGIADVLEGSPRRFDKGGDDFYDQISALHKAVRGSAPDAALYWYSRMLDGGCDPLYIARRVVRMASEDIGNADPRALSLSLDAWQVLERLGSPEGELALAQAVLYLASAPKSNASYRAFKAAGAAVAAAGSHDVPVHLRNAPTELARSEGHGAEYRYAHDEPNAYAAGECYFPAALGRPLFYTPTDYGLEGKIAQRLQALRQLDEDSEWQRYADDEGI